MWPPEKTRREEIIDYVLDAAGTAASEGCFGCLFHVFACFAIVITAGFWLFW